MDTEKNHKEILEETIKELLLKMDITGDVAVTQGQDSLLIVKITSDEAGLLIGQNGINLAALQHLARIIANRGLGAVETNFIIDVNDYRASRLELIKSLALALAEQVVADRRAKVLEPMPPYERRMVHTVLSDYQGVRTESEGEGEERRVVIKPAGEI